MQMALYGKRGCAGGGRANAWASGANDLRLAIKNKTERFNFVLFSKIKIKFLLCIYIYMYVGMLTSKIQINLTFCS